MNILVRIDPNIRVRHNQTCAGFDDCTVVPMIGDPVTVYEPEAAIEGPAVVTGIDESKQLIYMDVKWPELHGIPEDHST